jgi:hypothetical protein
MFFIYFEEPILVSFQKQNTSKINIFIDNYGIFLLKKYFKIILRWYTSLGTTIEIISQLPEISKKAAA